MHNRARRGLCCTLRRTSWWVNMMIFVVRADRCRRTRVRDVALARHAVVHRRPATVHNRRACGLWCTLRRTQLGKSLQL